jgi:signal transduction histidine kinase
MNRTAVTWVSFTLGAIIVAAALGWVTHTATQLDDVQRDLQRDITTQQATRLALWRMDSAAMPWLAVENVRPFTFYQQALDEQLEGNNGPQQAVRLYFQFDPDGALSSPQVDTNSKAPDGAHAKDLAFVSEHFARDVLTSAMPVNGFTPALSTQPPAVSILGGLVSAENGNRLNVADAQQKRQSYQQQSAVENERDYRQRGNNYNTVTNNIELRVEVNQQALEQQTQFARVPKANAEPDRDKQEVTIQPQVVLGGSGQGQQIADVHALQSQFQFVQQPNGVTSPGWVFAEYEPMRPIVIGDVPLIVRRVTVDGRQYVQGCLLDWAWIRQQLLVEVGDLLPNAQLALVSNDTADDTTYRLAALPVALTPGVVPLPELPASPLRTALVVAWSCLIAGTVAVGVLLFGVMQLSQRRAAFVRAVTHEMRTPLTTFQLYTELLASGRVKTSEQQQQYVSTLHRESDRLSHMVENVLAHARLERKQKPAALGTHEAGALLDRAWDRLCIRVEQAGMQLVRKDFADASATAVRAEPGSVEQVLLNLVDNACKYAAKAEDRHIHIELEAGAKHVIIRVTDHGPGLPAAQRRRLFRAFNKSADEAALSAPGVGLGLALSRRLARSMGGDLRLDKRYKGGAAFEFLLPRA